MKRPTLTMLVAGAALLVGGCAEQFEIIDELDPDEAIPPAIQDAFDRSCATGSCHDAVTAAGGLSLAPQDAADIIGAPSLQSALPLVEIGSVEGSYLAIKMLADDTLPPDATRVGTRMPPSPNDDELVDMALIIGWIAGAELPTSGAE